MKLVMHWCAYIQEVSQKKVQRFKVKYFLTQVIQINKLNFFLNLISVVNI